MAIKLKHKGSWHEIADLTTSSSDPSVSIFIKFAFKLKSSNLFDFTFIFFI